MRLPQMTTRRWMIVVALIAVVLGLYAWILPYWQRADEYRFMAKYHDWMRQQAIAGGNSTAPLYHLRLKEKYDYAAAHPWLPVEPDPEER